jgi:hypothetical protein
MLLINHIRPTHIFNIIHIRVTAKSLYTILGAAFATLAFLDIVTILVLLHPMGTDTA